MKSLLVAAAMAAAAFGPTAVSAATATAEYVATSHLEGNPQHPEHTVWFSGGSNPAGATGYNANHFLFENGSLGFGSFTQYDDGTASLTGEVANDDGQSFVLEMNLMEVVWAGASKIVSGASTADWIYYVLDPNKSSTLIGALGSFDISLYGTQYVAQFGTGANDKNANLLGFSSWINLTDSNCSSNCVNYKGDINILLEPIPLPPSFAMLIAGLGGVGFVARRRRKG